MINIEDLTQEHVTVSIRWISKMSTPECWSLTDAELAALLGGTIDSYYDILNQAECDLPISLTSETIERLSLLLGIWKGLQMLAPSGRDDLALRWFNTPNSSSLLQGRTLKNYLLENNTLEAFYTVRRYLNFQG